MVIAATGVLVIGGLVLAIAAVAACVLASRISRDLEAPIPGGELQDGPELPWVPNRTTHASGSA